MIDARGGEGTVVFDYSDKASTFGDRLALARELAGLDQPQLAQRIGVRLQALRNWEQDRSEPRANRLQILAGILNVPLVWLMSGQGAGPAAATAGPPADPAALACLADLRSLRAEQRHLAEKLGRLERQLRAVLG
jgi:HTH-type transcriptional regulator, cell division transcriptional repressor